MRWTDYRSAIFLSFLLMIVPAAASGGDVLWSSRFGVEGNLVDYPTAMAADPVRDVVYITGFTAESGHTDEDMVIIALNTSNGNELWNRTWSSGQLLDLNDHPVGIAVDPEGSRLYVTGWTAATPTNTDIITLAYDLSNATANPTLSWTAKFDSGGHYDVARALAVSPNGSMLFVGGTTDTYSETTGNYTVLAYNASTGAKLWSATYEGPGMKLDDASDLIVGGNGSRVYITGKSDGNTSSVNLDYASVAYNASTGAELWVARYDGGHGEDIGRALAESPDDGAIFVTGSSYGSTTVNAVTIGYDASGLQLWSSTYVGIAQLSGIEYGDDKVFVGGGSSSIDYLAVMYHASNGTQGWAYSYNGPSGGPDQTSALSFFNGTLVLTGKSSENGLPNPVDYATVAVNATSGAERWVQRHAGDASDIAYGVVTKSGAAYVTGMSFTITRDPILGDIEDANIYTLAYEI